MLDIYRLTCLHECATATKEMDIAATLLYTTCYFVNMDFKSVPPVVSNTSLTQIWHIRNGHLDCRQSQFTLYVLAKLKV